jgi:hypothetical protein
MGQICQVVRRERQHRDRDRRAQRCGEAAGCGTHSEGPTLATELAVPPLAQLRRQ